MTVTVAIKAFNEEAHIAEAIESALAAVAELGGGEVVLADCASTDATQDIAGRYPVRVLCLTNAEDRSCGAGAQLAFQGVSTPYFYLMDGDMTLVPGFLPKALAWLCANPEFAGVGGHVKDRYLDNAEFRIREAAQAHEAHRRAGPVDRLDGGGLYRTAAIRDIGYFADPDLSSYEEFDLAARLDAAGWKVARIDADAIWHSGHRIDGLSLLIYRFRSGQLGGAGALLRAALGKPHWAYTLRHLRQVRTLAAILAWWAVLFASLASGAWAAALGLIALPLAFLAYRRRSLALGAYSFLSWNLVGVAMLRSFLKSGSPRRRDGKVLDFRVEHKP